MVLTRNKQPKFHAKMMPGDDGAPAVVGALPLKRVQFYLEAPLDRDYGRARATPRGGTGDAVADKQKCSGVCS